MKSSSKPVVSPSVGIRPAGAPAAARWTPDELGGGVDFGAASSDASASSMPNGNAADEMRLRLEPDGGKASEALARVRAHIGVGDTKVTELELIERTDAR